MRISVIIPVLNEQDVIGETLRKVRAQSSTEGIEEIIVVDGGSRDHTTEIAERLGATVISSPVRSRAAQMNLGARKAKGELLYFLHADSIPPRHFDLRIRTCVQSGNKAGCFRLRFDRDHWLLNFYGWCTRFDIDLFRFGDQSLFITRELFEGIDGFRGDLVIMEDQDIVRRIKRREDFKILPGRVTTSSRRYMKNGILKLQLTFTLIIIGYYLGASQSSLVGMYNTFIE